MKNILSGTGLPYSFKKIGLILIFTGFFIPLLLTNSFERELLSDMKMTFLLLGMIVLLLSKGKNEDEMTEKIRLIALAYGFIFMLLLVIVSMWFFEEVLISSIVLASVFPSYVMMLILERRNAENERKGNNKLILGIVAIILTVIIALWFSFGIDLNFIG